MPTNALLTCEPTRLLLKMVATHKIIAIGANKMPRNGTSE